MDLDFDAAAELEGVVGLDKGLHDGGVAALDHGHPEVVIQPQLDERSRKERFNKKK